MNGNVNEIGRESVMPDRRATQSTNRNLWRKRKTCKQTNKRAVNCFPPFRFVYILHSSIDYVAMNGSENMKRRESTHCRRATIGIIIIIVIRRMATDFIVDANKYL